MILLLCALFGRELIDLKDRRKEEKNLKFFVKKEKKKRIKKKIKNNKINIRLIKK